MSGEVAPIVLFAFNRAEHLSRCIASLKENPEAPASDLYIYCDGPRHDGDRPGVQAVRAMARGVVGFRSVNVVERQQNLGLAASIIGGVSALLAVHERLIVLEDDLLLSPYFLEYMNAGLTQYENDEKVCSIHGYCWPVDASLPETFFLRGADCWGWATWRRAWSGFRSDGAGLLKELREKGLTYAFDLDGAFPFTQMLADQVAGRNNSWAIRWHASCFLKEMLTLYPGKSLVHNLGNDSSGTHSKTTRRYDVDIQGSGVQVREIPIEPSVEARDAIIRFLRPSSWRRMRQRGWAVLSWLRGEIS